MRIITVVEAQHLLSQVIKDREIAVITRHNKQVMMVVPWSTFFDAAPNPWPAEFTMATVKSYRESPIAKCIQLLQQKPFTVLALRAQSGDAVYVSLEMYDLLNHKIVPDRPAEGLGVLPTEMTIVEMRSKILHFAKHIYELQQEGKVFDTITVTRNGHPIFQIIPYHPDKQE